MPKKKKPSVPAPALAPPSAPAVTHTQSEKPTEPIGPQSQPQTTKATTEQSLPPAPAPAKKCQICGKDSSMRCPKCLAGSAAAYFCSESCFKVAWPTHKLLHVVPHSTPTEEAFYDPRFAGYDFTGSVRPGRLSPKRTVPAHIPKPDYAETGIPKGEMQLRGNNTIEVKNAEQIQGMREACRVAREVINSYHNLAHCCRFWTRQRK